MIIFHVKNTWTEIEGADHFALYLFDLETKYPTEIAEARMRGHTLPYEAPEHWDGWIRMLRQPKTKLPWFPTGLLSRLTRACTKLRLPFQVNDQRERPLEGFPDFPKISLRDYQQEAVKTGIEKGLGILEMPPRSGKTRTMLEIVRSLGLSTLWIAPTERICAQTRDVIAGFFGDSFVTQIVGKKNENKASDSRIVICTTATAAILSPAFYATREILVVDEYHHAAAKTYHKDIFPKCDHIFHRFGMTGTFFRSGNDEMALHAFLSDTIYKITSQNLVNRGYLVPTCVVFLPVQSPKLRGMPTSSYQGGHGKYGIQEHRIRNELVTWVSVLLYQFNKRVLVLVGTKRQGKELSRLMSAFVRPQVGTEFRPVEFISTDTPRPIQQKVIDAFLESDEVKILIGTSLLGEGVDLPTADALVYARGEKGEVSLVQNAYRVSTALPGKRYALIVDFADRHHKKLMSHSHDRLSIYYREPTFQVRVLSEARQFASFMSQLPTT
jgi:superfamily II DNA or RNA helicase